MTAPLLDIVDLKKHFLVRRSAFGAQRGWVRAVDGVTFQVRPGETLGLVGESGCGKSTVARIILRLIEPTSGAIRFDGEDLLALEGEALRRRRADVQLIFQDPYGSLDPRQTVEQIVGEPLVIHGVGGRAERRDRVLALIERVGLSAEHLRRHPHEFSGGQRQRIGIARALALNPKLVVCDEAVSALDVSIQAQVVNLLKRLQRDVGLTYLFVAHDLAVVRHISNRVAVMYLGRIVELAPTAELFARPHHPYTQALLSAIPRPKAEVRRSRVLLSGDVPSPMAPPSGCRFHTRCPLAVDRCRIEDPPTQDLGEGRSVACHLVRPGEAPPDIRRAP
ncbi:MAG: dipeptide ABC transporter ATP-binding protein [Alphaproteobacteria bacterium]|nr:dipeptide ABC transporter ATP-binding protein [Alphaproteobacteria bacterium]